MEDLFLGAAPGLSPTMAVVLSVPLTFQMDPTAGLVLLGAVYTSTVAGAAISAILLTVFPRIAISPHWFEVENRFFHR
jgi:putative tricarboxylic transport membrane protein